MLISGYFFWFSHFRSGPYTPLHGISKLVFGIVSNNPPSACLEKKSCLGTTRGQPAPISLPRKRKKIPPGWDLANVAGGGSFWCLSVPGTPGQRWPMWIWCVVPPKKPVLGRQSRPFLIEFGRDLARAFFMFAALMFSPLVFLNGSSNSNHDVAVLLSSWLFFIFNHTSLGRSRVLIRCSYQITHKNCHKNVSSLNFYDTKCTRHKMSKLLTVKSKSKNHTITKRIITKRFWATEHIITKHIITKHLTLTYWLLLLYNYCPNLLIDWLSSLVSDWLYPGLMYIG